jgi:YfiH family protein
MYRFFRDPGADGVGVAFSDAIGPDGSVLSLGGAHGAAGRAPGLAVLETDLGLPLAVVRQVHGATVADADELSLADLAGTEADALVATRAGVALAVRVADCVPVLFADAQAGVIGAAHAGRNGLAAGVLQATVVALRARGAQSITAWIGPHVCGACYEVPAAMADEIAGRVPGTRATTSWGTPALDLGAGAAQLLAAAGVTVVDASACTLEQPDLHSYRRDGAASGRQAGIIWLAGACRTNNAG